MLVVACILAMSLHLATRVPTARWAVIAGPVPLTAVLFSVGLFLHLNPLKWLLAGAVAMVIHGFVLVVSLTKVMFNVRRMRRQEANSGYGLLTDEMCLLLRDQRLLTEHALAAVVFGWLVGVWVIVNYR